MAPAPAVDDEVRQVVAAASSAFDSAAPMKPTSEDRGRRGGARRSCRAGGTGPGALPMATTDRRAAPARARARRPSGWSRAGRRDRGPGSRRVADDVVAGRQAGPRDAGGHHLGVAEDRGAVPEGPRDAATRAGAGDVGGEVHLTAGVDHPHRHRGEIGREPGRSASARIGDRPAVDLGAVPDVAADHGTSPGRGTPSTR